MSEMIDDDVLLSTLGAALAPEPTSPNADQMAALHSALDARSGLASVAVPDAVIVPFHASGRSTGTRSARIHRLRHPVAVLVGVAVLATSGVAAAGVATDTMPAPARHVAYSIGLPVTSPALESARSTMHALDLALQGHDRAAIVASSALLKREIAALSASDRSLVEPAAGRLLASADSFLDEDATIDSPATSIPPTTGTGTHADTGDSDSTRPSDDISTTPAGSSEPTDRSDSSVPPVDGGSGTPPQESGGGDGPSGSGPAGDQGSSGDSVSSGSSDSGTSQPSGSPRPANELSPAADSTPG